MTWFEMLQLVRGVAATCWFEGAEMPGMRDVQRANTRFVDAPFPFPICFDRLLICNLVTSRVGIFGFDFVGLCDKTRGEWLRVEWKGDVLKFDSWVPRAVFQNIKNNRGVPTVTLVCQGRACVSMRSSERSNHRSKLADDVQSCPCTSLQRIVLGEDMHTIYLYS
jgi:hypothetical protein